MFRDAIPFNSSLDNWKLSKIENLEDMFTNAKSFNQSINSWKLRAKNDNKNDKDISMYDMFFDASLYNQPMNEWDVSSVTNFSYMFQNAKKFNQNLSSWTISDDAYVSNMFAGSSMNLKNEKGQIYYCEMIKEASWSKFTPEYLGFEPDICE